MMVRLIVRHLGLLAVLAGAMLVAAVPAMAYVDTSPGSGGSTSSSTVAPGQSFTFTATFTDLPAGTSVTFSSSCAGTTFSPSSGTLDSAHQVSTTVTIPSSCAGQTVTLTATAAGGATVSSTVTVSGGFPNTAAAPQSLPIGWLVVALGLLLLAAGTFGLTRRSRSISSGVRA